MRRKIARTAAREQAGRVRAASILAAWAEQKAVREIMVFLHSHGVVLNEDDMQTYASKKISGDPKSKKLRIVCNKCNNEWMSDLQNATKPTLIPLLRRQQITLSEPRQRHLATWVAMTVICAERLPCPKDLPSYIPPSPSVRYHA